MIAKMYTGLKDNGVIKFDGVKIDTAANRKSIISIS